VTTPDGAVVRLGVMSLEDAVKAAGGELLKERPARGAAAESPTSTASAEPVTEEVSTYSWADGAKAVSVYVDAGAEIDDGSMSESNEGAVRAEVVRRRGPGRSGVAEGREVELRIKLPSTDKSRPPRVLVLLLSRLFAKVRKVTWKAKAGGRVVLKLWKEVPGPWAKLQLQV
jgi:hypothetical protein